MHMGGGGFWCCTGRDVGCTRQDGTWVCFQGLTDITACQLLAGSCGNAASPNLRGGVGTMECTPYAVVEVAVLFVLGGTSNWVMIPVQAGVSGLCMYLGHAASYSACAQPPVSRHWTHDTDTGTV